MDSIIFPPICVSLSVDIIIVQVLFRQLCCWDFAGIASFSTVARRHNTKLIPWSSHSYDPSAAFSSDPKPLFCGDDWSAFSGME